MTQGNNQQFGKKATCPTCARVRRYLLILLTACVVALLMLEFARAESIVVEPSGYRLSNYRAAVPQTLQGGQVLHSATELQQLLHAHANIGLIDVYPADIRPAVFGKTDLWIEPTRDTIPNALWLANVGLGIMPTALKIFYEQQLRTLSGGDVTTPLIIFCEPACWHSWNASKRAISLGYHNVYWYVGGVSNWREAGLQTDTVEPIRP